MVSLLSQRITSYRKDKEAIIDGIEMHFTWPGIMGEAGITVNVQPSY